MDTKQRICLDLIQNSHNVCILGQAGTGKTFTLRKVVEIMRTNLNVTLTCYTGVAGLQYKGFNPVTLHKFAGLEDGRHSKEKITYLLQTDEQFLSTASKIKDTELLIIDEVSMVSKQVLESVEYVCRQLKDKNKVFGGMQVVLSGDLFQLPPIKDELIGDNGDYCFNAIFFSDFFPHIIVLTNIHRQNEPDLITAVNELEQGKPSDHTNMFIKSLARPLGDICDPTKIVKLHARNFNADFSNYKCLQALNTTLHVFEAEDAGDIYYLKKMIVPKILGVKIGAQVMLLRNINDIHVNGLVGTVADVTSDSIHVNFDGVMLKLERYAFSKFDPVTSIALATRYQFPLRLAYAITIHKSQGMSLPLLEVDCQFATNPGQIGVAIGRSMFSAGLRVLNYSPHMVKKHPDCVYNFYDSINAVTSTDDSNDCCKIVKKCKSLETEHHDSDQEVLGSDSEDELTTELCSFDCKINMEHNYSSTDVSHFSMQLDFETAIQDFIGTPAEQSTRMACTQILHSSVSLTWYSHQCKEIRKLFDACFPSEPGKYEPKQFADFYSSIQQYITSHRYVKDIEQFSSVPGSSKVLTSVIFVIQSNLLKQISEQVKEDDCQKNIFPSSNIPDTNAGRGKIRYVGGYCVAKCRYRLCSSLQNCLYRPGMEPEIDKLNEQINILDNVIVSAAEIKSSSKYQETLKETERKQNVREGLINITDNAFDFFEILEKKAVSFMQYESLYKEKKYFFRYVVNNVLSCTDLLESFISNWAIALKNSSEPESIDSCVKEICSSLSSMCSHVLTVFEMIVKLFVTVNIAQFRKDYLRLMKKEKSLALRKKVLQKTQKKRMECVPMQFITNDNSLSKTNSHFKLKAVVHGNEQFYSDYKKAELILLLKAYGKEMSTRSTKKELGQKLYQTLIDDTCVSMINPDILNSSNEQLRRTSSQVVRGSNLTETVTEDEHSTTVAQSTGNETGIEYRGKSHNTVPGSSTAGLSSTDTQTTISLSINTPTAGCSSTDTPPADYFGADVSSVSYSCERVMGEQTVTRRRKTVSRKEVKQVPKGQKGKGKKKRSIKTADDDSKLCSMCGKFYTEGDHWICCDSCQNGCHRFCVHLDNDDDWEYYSSPDAVYICPLCL